MKLRTLINEMKINTLTPGKVINYFIEHQKYFIQVVWNNPTENFYSDLGFTSSEYFYDNYKSIPNLKIYMESLIKFIKEGNIWVGIIGDGWANEEIVRKTLPKPFTNIIMCSDEEDTYAILYN